MNKIKATGKVSPHSPKSIRDAIAEMSNELRPTVSISLVRTHSPYSDSATKSRPDLAPLSESLLAHVTSQMRVAA